MMKGMVRFGLVMICIAVIAACATVPKVSSTPMNKPAKVALVLGAGAAKGFAHIGVLKILESFFAFGKGVADTGLEGPPAEINNGKLAAMIVMVLAAVVCVDNLGFPIANFLFLLVFMRIAGLKRKIPLFLISFLGTIVLLYLFVKVVYLPLPKGQWFFNDLTIVIYRALRII